MHNAHTIVPNESAVFMSRNAFFEILKIKIRWLYIIYTYFAKLIHCARSNKDQFFSVNL